MHLAFAEEFLPRRHLVGPTLHDRLDDLRFGTAIEPDLVGEIRRAERLLALAIHAVTGETDSLIALLSLGRQSHVVLESGERTHIVRQFLRPGLAAHRIRIAAIRRHHPGAPVADRFDDLLRFAAPLPVLVGQIREALVARALPGRPVALDAIGLEQAAPHFHGFLVRSDGFQVHLQILVEQRLDLRFDFLDFRLVRAGRGPVPDAGEASERRIQDDIGQGEEHGHVEQPHPPAWQRVVVFRQRLVPDMPGGVGCLLVSGVVDALKPEKDAAGDDADQNDQNDIPVPELIDEIAHDVFLCSWRRTLPVSRCSASSSVKGRLAASSKRCRFPLTPYAHQTMPRKVAKETTVTMDRRSLMSMAYLTPLSSRPMPCR